MFRSRLVKVAVWALLVAAGGCRGSVTSQTGAAAGLGASASWPFWGGDLNNTHFAATESQIGPDNAGSLRPKWIHRTSGDVTAIPTITGDQLYVTDWGSPLGSLKLPPGGTLRAIDRHTGRTIWLRLIASYDPHKLYNLSRSSPAVAGDLLVFGDWLDGPLAMLAGLLGAADVASGGTTLYAVNRFTGQLVWKTQLDSHPTSMVTQSPIVHDGRIYVGVSSKESVLAKFPYPCCTFRGSVVSVDLPTGQLLWKTFLVPENGGLRGGYSGGAVWSGAPTIDPARGLVYVGTGQNYDAPAPLKDCMLRWQGQPALQQSECLDRLGAPDNHANSIVALDLKTGDIRWSKKLFPYDVWNFACDPRLIAWVPPFVFNCPAPSGHDFDVTQIVLMKAPIAGLPGDLLAVGQKSGTFWGLDPDHDGDVIWSQTVGPGGYTGGVEFGAATDGNRIYAQVTNFENNPFTLTAGAEAGSVVHGGIWVALDPATGQLLWQTHDPASDQPVYGFLAHPVWGPGLGEGFFGHPMGPLTVANGVLFGGSMDRAGHMYGLRADTGEIIWSFASGGSVLSAPTIIDGTLYWGSGSFYGVDNDELYAFALP